MVQHLKQLRAGQSIRMPVYDYTIHNRSDKTVTVDPAPVIIVEGILIFASQELWRPDGHQGVCGHRRRRAHSAAHRPGRKKPRARTLDSVVTQYLTTVKPMHEQFVEPSKRKADLMHPGGRQKRRGAGHADQVGVQPSAGGVTPRVPCPLP